MTRSSFDGRRYRNPGPSALKGLPEVLRWQATSRPRPWPSQVALATEGSPPATVAPGRVAATFVNHSTFVLQAGGLAVVTDPMWSARASPVSWAGPRRVHPPGVGFDALLPVDVVLLSHDHYDHLDQHTLARLEERDRPAIVTLRGNERHLARHARSRVHPLDWWESIDVRGARITATPAQHFSGRGPLDRNRALWGGFVVEWEGPTVFCAGDTGYWQHFREVREVFGRVGLALLPIGAYEPRWFMAKAHMNPSDAVRAHTDLGRPPSIGMHFGTFRLTDEAWDDPPMALAAALQGHGIDPAAFRAPRPGQTFIVGPAGFEE